MGRYERDSVVSGRTACSGSCGNMMARGVSAADAVQQRGCCDEVKALPAGAAALVVLVKERSAQCVDPVAGIEVVGPRESPATR